ncbi:MAG: M56 family metallopeptidase [Pedobacter sp.]|nr:MAG: M56 family metallopeptidase [Pedobacter sp.]
MMTWLYYLLEANLYLALFYGFYRLFLHNETFYSLNRNYLLISTCISFVLPIVQVSLISEAISQFYHNWKGYEKINQPSSIMASVGSAHPETSWLFIVYLVIVLFLISKLGLGIYKITRIWLDSNKRKIDDITLIDLNTEATAFSFFNLLFINPELADQPTVLKHEMVHIRQKHSYDIIFFELIQAISWFNPIVLLMKKDIKLLHEYIADELTTTADIHKHEYALFLIQNSFGLRPTALANQIFNQSILKRRINMLNKKRTGGKAKLRILLALPLVGTMLCTSTMAFTKDYGYLDLLPEKSSKSSVIQEKAKIDTLKNKKAIKRNQVQPPPPPPAEPLIPKHTAKKRNRVVPPPPVEPPPPGKKIVRFAPPIVKPDNKKSGNVAPPPPVEPPPPGYKSKKSTRAVTPPPPVEPPPPRKTNVKFAPPIVKPDNKKSNKQAPPPPVEPKKAPILGDPIPASETRQESSKKVILGDPIKNQ